MVRVEFHGRFGRFIPLWVRCAMAGLFVSLMVASGHWLMVEIGVLARPVFRQPDSTASGQSLIEAVHCRATGEWPREAPFTVDGYQTVSYGWPVANWGAVFRQRSAFYWQSGVEPLLTLDVQRIWARWPLPDPYENVAGQQLKGAPRVGMSNPRGSSLGYDPYERYLPVFPLIGHSLLACVIYGLPIYGYFRWREARLRRGACQNCGYDLSATPGISKCPECGQARDRSAERPRT